MTSSDADVLEAGRSVRADLPGLYPADNAWQQMDDQLAAALGEPDQRVAATKVRALLEANPETAQWFFVFRTTGRPPGPDARRGPASPLGGSGEVVAAPRFACPYGDYVWYRRSAARAIPMCRTHQVRLVISASSW